MAGMYVVVMAGGGGTRLRPLSTASRPKPFLPLLDTGETLLQRTVRRLEGLVHPGDVYVVAAPVYAPLIEAQVPEARVVVEPEARNTAAAIALATVAVDRPADDVMVVLPADHFIADEATFRRVIREAADGLAGGALGVSHPLVTLGVQPTYPATQYGYLVPELATLDLIGGLQTYRLEAFREKPPPADAEVLVGSPGVAWNAGMFLWRRDAIREALATWAPDVLDAVDRGWTRDDIGAAYAAINPRSIDYAVMEPAAAAGRVLMASMDVGWTDVGTWSVLLDVLGAAGIEAGVVEPGVGTPTAAGDLVIDRDHRGLVVIEASDATMTAERPVALLRGARGAETLVRALLDRCAAAEGGT
jgi:mannose-1-phosphate guanylyltransferase